MSEELDLEANILCIPEDAFEKFQAVSMYQEEEYILLPQNASPNPKPPECSYTNSTDVNEVVLSSTNRTISDGLEENQLNSSLLESSVDAETNLADTTQPSTDITSNEKNNYVNDFDMVVSNSEDLNNQGNSTVESSSLISHKTPRKRGRKPKKSITVVEPPSTTTPKNIQNPDISSTPYSSDPENSGTVLVARKKRGRPPKVRTEEACNSKVNNDREKDLSSGSDNNRLDDQCISKPKRGRRGSHAKNNESVVPTETDVEVPEQEPLIEEIQSNEVQNEQLSSSNETAGKRKRRKVSSATKSKDPISSKLDNLNDTETENIVAEENNKIPDSHSKMVCDSVSDDDDLDDICLSKLKSASTLPNVNKSEEDGSTTDNKIDGEIKDISSEWSNEQDKKTKRRRGRPKKEKNQSLSQMIENVDSVLDSTSGNETNIKDDPDDVCLTKLKTSEETLNNIKNENDTEPVCNDQDNSVIEVEINTSEMNGTPTKRNTKMPVMVDFEYNIDSVIGNDNTEVNNQYEDNSLLVEDTSKRPNRRKVKKFKYEEESDEDPFANVELSDDDEPRKRRKGNKYYSDDEYIPGKRGCNAVESTDTEVSDNNNDIDDAIKQRRRRPRKKSDNKSPKKKGKKDEESKDSQVEQKQNSSQNDDVEISSAPAIMKSNDSDSQSQSQMWYSSTEFENFLAKKTQGTNLKIKKVSSGTPVENKIIKIPVFDQDAKKTIEMCTQTISRKTASVAIQTSSPYETTLKDNIPLTTEQSEKACHFLKGIVQTTAELGVLMTQKSEDFIKKKIMTSHVVDTTKIDYCVKKSFLLFKLAKHNLQQMEEDLAKQYDEFLKANDLSKCKEQTTEILPTPKSTNSDSDCEIVEVEPSPSPKTPKNSQTPQTKPAFNPKTVFLNKELSIKIAKKPNENKKIDIKGRHTVWINDTVMVKKVKPTQSFLAQDSRNKKPPDNRVTIEMVSDFFKNYYRQKALSACAPFVSTDWLSVNKECVCNYFVVKPLQFNAEASYSDAGEFNVNNASNATESRPSLDKTISNNTLASTPERLFTLCFRILKIQLHDKKDITHKIRNEIADGNTTPVTLFRLCMRSIINNIDNMDRSATPVTQECSSTTIEMTVLPLKILCHRRIIDLLDDSSYNNSEEESNKDEIIYVSEESNDSLLYNSKETISQTHKNKNGLKSLFSLCVELFRRSQYIEKSDKNGIKAPSPLCIQNINKSQYTSKNGIKTLLSLCVEYIQKTSSISERNNNSILTPASLKKICFENVKLLLYHNDLIDRESAINGLMINSVNTLTEEAFLNLGQYNTDIPDGLDYQDDFDNDNHFEADMCDEDQTEPSWASQVQMQELRSCVNLNSLDVNKQQGVGPIITQIKLEPLDDISDNILVPAAVKTEPEIGLDEMTIIPDIIKPEIEEHIHAATLQRQNSSSYDADVFEEFVNGSKLMTALTAPRHDEVFSQSSARVRRQHEPDYYEESNADALGLLVPHTYEPMQIQTAKGSLMESSSDESNKNSINTSRKVIVKRSRGRPKKTEQKSNNKNIPTPPTVANKEKQNEVAALTRKMKEKIRQEEKKNESTDSEGENVTVRLRSREKKDASKQEREKPSTSTKGKNNEIQCNNVDSTERLEEDVARFSGFTSIETNEMSNYEKYMKFVYDKVIPDKEETEKDNKVAKDDTNKTKTVDKPLICPNEPVELLECEPTIPIFDEIIPEDKAPSKNKKSVESDDKPTYTDRHGWHCYPVDSSDSKLYHDAYIPLDRLPETFVQTYFKYQNVMVTKDDSDEEINRLTNLNSIKRSAIMKERKSQNNSKGDSKNDRPGNASDDSRTASDIGSDNELMPSDDDSPNIDKQAPPAIQGQPENVLAKNLLMEDKDSDDENTVKIKKEVPEGSESKISKQKHKKKGVEVEDNEDLMLTADKMMNKELTLLHAPVVLDDHVKDTTSKGPVTRHSKKSASKHASTSNKQKTEEDSSSEEEKQWVSTKEKLLKRMGKKDSAITDDAKRAKLVSEFIERREGNLDAHKRRGRRGRRSGKKFLEREKQLRVLQRELFGEMSNDPTVSKRSVAAAWKGRRNIRKVLDKKSLQRSTVIANMEEFERKRRLNSRTTKLRELLGCEEGVNVLVINDEVCLEYDFEEHRPVVTIHPFFTKVMKAHQYEGVKFMWDACFESLADIAAGHAGGGCILAHCMGLGKTLQVLALLHTVLTHPRVGMHRVLVCCPLSTVLNWVDEIHKWIGPVTNEIKVFELSKLKKTYERAYQLEDWYNGGGIFIIGYELFRSLSTLDPELDDVRPTIINKIRTALLDPGPDVIVCDEGHLLKNDCSVLAVAMSRVVTKRRIVLTGTPMQNNLREYYCMVNFVKPNLLGTYAEYSNRFENPIMNGQHRDSREEDIKLMKARTHILHKVLEGCLQRQEVSVLYPYLPKKHEYTVFITLTKCQWDLYKHYLNHYSRQMKQNSILRDFHILQKIWSHPQVLHNFQTKARENRNKIKMEKLEDDLATEDQEDIKDSVATELWWLPYLEGGDMLDSLESSNKFVVLFRILDECVALGDKVLIFSTSLFCLDVLEYFLKKIKSWSLGQEYYRLDGSVPAEVRQKWCREFNADNNVNTKLFLVSTRAGCLGLNMTAANRVIIMDTSWNPAHDIQSIFRVYRFGQKKDCFIYRLVALGTMEQKIYERAVTKQAVACRVVDEQQIDRHYNMAELTELYRYDEAGAGVAGGVAAGVRDVALLRVARCAALHAVHEHDSLLRSSEQGLPEHERNAAWMQFQLEHNHKQMENKLIVKIPKLELKRVQGQSTSSLEVNETNPAIKTENTVEEILPSPETKTRRGKRITNFSVKTKPSQTEPGESNPPPLHTYSRITAAVPGSSVNARKHYEEEMLVHKITATLIEHGFHQRKSSNEIGELVAKVKKIVKQGFDFTNDTPDELTASIAKIIQPQTMALPAITNSVSESLNQSVNANHLSGGYMVNAADVNKEPDAPDTKVKRKAAIAAEKHIDSLSEAIIIDLDDDMDHSDTEFVPGRIEKPEKTQTNKRKSSLNDRKSKYSPKTVRNSEHQQDTNTINEESLFKEKSTALKPKAGPKTFKEKLQRKYAELTKSAQELLSENMTESNSILLSDEDDTPTENQHSNSETSMVETSMAKTSTAETSILPDVEDEVIPLPLSLLTNKNFINIVAHTYLNGNPMLDTDAATLAAQYSTFKSLKEAEQTGKDIVSGPIYDIAVKVIGKQLFKKMQNSNIKASSKSIEATNISVELREKMRELTDMKSNKELKAKGKAKKNKSIENPASQICEPQHTIADVQTSTDVVPVGLIQMRSSMSDGGINQSSMMFSTNSESILPDDIDDMPIVPHALPDACLNTTSTITTSRPSSTLTQSLTPAYYNPPNATATSSTKSYIQINKGQIELPSQASDKVPQSQQNVTICLDSDEEDTNSARSQVPVTTVNAVPTTLLVEPMSTGKKLKVPVQAVQPKALILRQVAGGSAPKFVIVPNNPAESRTKEPVIAQTALQKLNVGPNTPVELNKQAITVPSGKMIQGICKPGDVIKINDAGEIEVVRSAPLSKLRNIAPKPSSVENSLLKPSGGIKETVTNTSSKTLVHTPAAKTTAPMKSVLKPAQTVKSKQSLSTGTKSFNKTVEQKLPTQTAQSKFNSYQKETEKLPLNKTNSNTSSNVTQNSEATTSRRVSISGSTSSSSRSSSPVDNNPLSILKNVVHIQAADEIPKPRQKHLNLIRTIQSEDSSVKIKHSTTTNSPYSLLTKCNKTYGNHSKIPATVKAKDPPQKSVTEKPLNTTRELNTKPSTFTPSNSGKEQPRKGVKELAGKTVRDTPSKTVNKPIPKAANNQTKKVENRKSITIVEDKVQKSSILCNMLSKSSTTSKPKVYVVPANEPIRLGDYMNTINLADPKPAPSKKPVTTVDLTHYPNVISGSGTSMLKTKIEVKKRVCSTETSTAKKKKTEPMTLKDFNLDDIDDIIELD